MITEKKSEGMTTPTQKVSPMDNNVASPQKSSGEGGGALGKDDPLHMLFLHTQQQTVNASPAAAAAIRVMLSKPLARVETSNLTADARSCRQHSRGDDTPNILISPNLPFHQSAVVLSFSAPEWMAVAALDSTSSPSFVNNSNTVFSSLRALLAYFLSPTTPAVSKAVLGTTDLNATGEESPINRVIIDDDNDNSNRLPPPPTQTIRVLHQMHCVHSFVQVQDPYQQQQNNHQQRSNYVHIMDTVVVERPGQVVFTYLDNDADDDGKVPEKDRGQAATKKKGEEEVVGPAAWAASSSSPAAAASAALDGALAVPTPGSSQILPSRSDSTTFHADSLANSPFVPAMCLHHHHPSMMQHNDPQPPPPPSPNIPPEAASASLIDDAIDFSTRQPPVIHRKTLVLPKVQWNLEARGCMTNVAVRNLKCFGQCSATQGGALHLLGVEFAFAYITKREENKKEEEESKASTTTTTEVPDTTMMMLAEGNGSTMTIDDCTIDGEGTTTHNNNQPHPSAMMSDEEEETAEDPSPTQHAAVADGPYNRANVSSDANRRKKQKKIIFVGPGATLTIRNSTLRNVHIIVDGRRKGEDDRREGTTTNKKDTKEPPPVSPPRPRVFIEGSYLENSTIHVDNDGEVTVSDVGMTTFVHHVEVDEEKGESVMPVQQPLFVSEAIRVKNHSIIKASLLQIRNFKSGLVASHKSRVTLRLTSITNCDEGIVADGRETIVEAEGIQITLRGAATDVPGASSLRNLPPMASPKQDEAVRTCVTISRGAHVHFVRGPHSSVSDDEPFLTQSPPQQLPSFTETFVTMRTRSARNTPPPRGVSPDRGVAAPPMLLEPTLIPDGGDAVTQHVAASDRPSKATQPTTTSGLRELLEKQLSANVLDGSSDGICVRIDRGTFHCCDTLLLGDAYGVFARLPVSLSLNRVRLDGSFKQGVSVNCTPSAATDTSNSSSNPTAAGRRPLSSVDHPHPVSTNNSHHSNRCHVTLCDVTSARRIRVVAVLLVHCDGLLSFSKKEEEEGLNGNAIGATRPGKNEANANISEGQHKQRSELCAGWAAIEVKGSGSVRIQGPATLTTLGNSPGPCVRIGGTAKVELSDCHISSEKIVPGGSAIAVVDQAHLVVRNVTVISPFDIGAVVDGGALEAEHFFLPTESKISSDPHAELDELTDQKEVTSAATSSEGHRTQQPSPQPSSSSSTNSSTTAPVVMMRVGCSIKRSGRMTASKCTIAGTACAILCYSKALVSLKLCVLVNRIEQSKSASVHLQGCARKGLFGPLQDLFGFPDPSVGGSAGAVGVVGVGHQHHYQHHHQAIAEGTGLGYRRSRSRRNAKRGAEVATQDE